MREIIDNRWQANRIGFVNFWVYDYEVFNFSEGKLLLRGANGTGKSITTQSIIPFILDGDRTPSRLDPFGTNDKKMEDYLLFDPEKNDVSAYIFMEFKKRESEQYITIGIGQRAVRGKPMDFWGFVILDGRRIGFDFQLFEEIGDKRMPLTKQILKNKLKVDTNDNIVVDNQRKYKEMVNKYIFGFAKIEEYEKMLALLIKLRGSKLSKGEFKPTTIYNILNSSLQALSDDDLSAMVDAMEKMDDISRRLEDLKRAYIDSKVITSEYVKYNNFTLAKKAKNYIDKHLYLSKIEKDINTIDNEISAKTDELIKSKANKLDLETEIQILENERANLNVTDIELNSQKLSKYQNQLENEKNNIRELNKTIDSNKSKLNIQYSELKALENNIDSVFADIFKSKRELDSFNSTLKFDGHQNLVKFIDIIEKDSLINHFAIERSKILREIKTDIKNLSQVIYENILRMKELQKIATDIDILMEKHFVKLSQKNSISDELTKAQNICDELKNNLIETFYKMVKNTELKLSDDDVHNISLKFAKYNLPSDFTPIKAIVDNVKSARESYLLEERILYNSEINKHKKELDELNYKLEQLKNSKEPVFEQSDKVSQTRKKLRENNIEFLALYEALEFDENLCDIEKSMIEEQLNQANLLNSLIVSENDYEKSIEILSLNCDSLVKYDKSIITNYNKLKVGDVSDNLKSAVYAFINNIDEELNSFESKNTIVINKNGYFKNGIIEGYSTHSDTPMFLGKLARKQNLKRQVEKLELEISNVHALISEVSAKLDITENSYSLLQKEYSAVPNAQELDLSLDLVKNTQNKLDNISSELEELTGKLSAENERHKRLEQLIISSTNSLPYSRQIDVYEEVHSYFNSYDSMVQDLGDNLINFENFLLKKNFVSDNIYSIESLIDDKLKEQGKLEINIKLLETEIKQIDEFLKKPETREIYETLARINAGLKNNNDRIKELIGIIATLEANIENNKEKADSLDSEINNAKLIYLKVKKIFEEELYLEFVFSHAEIKSESEKEIADICFNLANLAISKVKESELSKSALEAYTSLHKVFSDHSANLVYYGIAMEELFGAELDVENYSEDYANTSNSRNYSDEQFRKRYSIVSIWNGKKVSLQEFNDFLKNTIEENELIIKENDREIFEDILSQTISRKLSNRIHESRRWIVDMSKIMKNLDTSMGLKFSLEWIPKNAVSDEELDIKELERILSMDSELLSQTDIEKVSLHFRNRIKIEKQALIDRNESVNYQELVRNELDYRNWFEFKMSFYRSDGTKRELTNSAFNKFSGGMKAMAMYVPLFASLNAQYQKIENKSYPRVLALDEAFAGVDEKNIGEMFDLMQKLDFDFILNSQNLWGTYPQVTALHISELQRIIGNSTENNLIFDDITIINYNWNGVVKTLVE